MDRYVMRHPDLPGPPALVPASSMRRHKVNGWIRVSDAIPFDDMDQVDVEAYVGKPDLDAAPAEAKPESPAKTTKEK